MHKRDKEIFLQILSFNVFVACVYGASCEVYFMPVTDKNEKDQQIKALNALEITLEHCLITPYGTCIL